MKCRLSRWQYHHTDEAAVRHPIWIWTHLEPWNISSEVTKELGGPRNELWLSPLSIWELVLLVEKKRLDLNADIGACVHTAQLRD